MSALKYNKAAAHQLIHKVWQRGDVDPLVISVDTDAKTLYETWQS